MGDNRSCFYNEFLINLQRLKFKILNKLWPQVFACCFCSVCYFLLPIIVIKHFKTAQKIINKLHKVTVMKLSLAVDRKNSNHVMNGKENKKLFDNYFTNFNWMNENNGRRKKSCGRKKTNFIDPKSCSWMDDDKWRQISMEEKCEFLHSFCLEEVSLFFFSLIFVCIFVAWF